MTRLFIATPTASVQGGVERILEALARHLPAHGFDVVFGLARGARFHDPARFREAFPSVRGVECDARSGTAYGRRRALRRAIERADPDIVLAARLFDTYPVCAELKTRGHPLRHAVTVQAFESEYIIDLARYADFVDLCVTSGNLIAAAVKEFTPMPAERVRSIPGGVAPPRRFVEHDPAAPLRIGYVGRLEQTQKRALDLAELIAELERRGVVVNCRVTGDGSAAGELRRRLPSARFEGWLPVSELYERVYPELDVLVHFAEWEGITIAPREAMAHGVVPVVSRFVGIEEERQFVDGVNALTFPIGAIAEAANAVERLDRDRELLVRLSAAARGSQEGIHSEQGAVRAWADALRFALETPSRAGARIPPAPVDRGVLSRAGIPDALAELLRAIRRRRHSEPGAEWPHWSGEGDPVLDRAIRAFGGLHPGSGPRSAISAGRSRE